MEPPVRKTLPGQMPSSWMRPKRGTVIWLALVTLAYGAFLLLSAPAEGTLDARIIYTPDDITELLTRQGDEGRAAYLAAALADLGFIVVYSILYVTWIRFFRARRCIPRFILPAFALLPGVADLLETVSIVGVLRAYPDQPATYAWLAAIGTPLKWLAHLAMIALLLLGEIWWRRGNRF
jgi:hypothetical protein